MNIRLGLCSAYSLLYGVHKPEALLDRAVSYGVKTASICDLDNLYGLHSFLEAAEERGIRPVIGANLTIPHSLSPTPRYLYCFVENRAGFARLCEVLTERNKENEKLGIRNEEKVISMLRENSCGLVLASPDENILKSLAGRVKKLYAAITADDIGVIRAHKALSLPLAFLDTSVFLEKGDYALHKTLRAIGLNKTVGNLKGHDLVAEDTGFFKTDAELRRRLNSWPEAKKGTREIAELCQFRKVNGGLIFPSYGENPGDELRKRVYKGAELRYRNLGDREFERIEYELDIIEKMGFSPYFLRIDDIVKMASQRTCGRGSGAASIVSYALGITNVDPIRHNLYFERFLNSARPDPPDIDIDFAWDERDDLIKAIIERFGPEYCARVANHNFFRPRSALREAAKAYGFSDGAITQLEKRIFDYGEKAEMANPLWQEVFKIAAQIEGLPRGLSMHCGGVLITPKPVRRYAPVEKSAEGFPLLAWDKDGAEAAGFVKIDLLGNRSLAVIRDAVSNVKLEGRSEELEDKLNRALDDKATIEALARGDSMGVFYIESPAMRQLQMKTGKGDFEHIVIHSSLIRPAANRFIAEYIRRLKGAKWEPLHPRLENILGESYGILCYQEDVSKAAIALAGFNEADADKLRKVIAKKAGGAKLAVYENQFFEGCRENDVPEDTIKRIWAMMLSFDGYSFCKPHSASYAMVSFQSAYLRVHYPAEFMAAVLSNQGGYYRPGAYVSECRRMGLFIEGPDVNSSGWKYFGISSDQLTVNNGKRVYRGKVIIGLMAVKGLSASGAESIIAERDRGGEFRSLGDFSRRLRLGRDDILALCPAGVFDSIADGLPRPLQARQLLQVRSEKLEVRNGELFESEPGASSHLTYHLSLITYHLLRDEYRALGFLRNVHPLALWKNEILALKQRVKALHIGNYVGSYVKMVGWPVTKKDVWTKDGLTMSFLTLEDETAIYETVVFPQVYDKYHRLLFDQEPLLVYGLVSSDEGAISLEMRKIEFLEKKAFKA